MVQGLQPQLSAQRRKVQSQPSWQYLVTSTTIHGHCGGKGNCLVVSKPSNVIRIRTKYADSTKHCHHIVSLYAHIVATSKTRVFWMPPPATWCPHARHIMPHSSQTCWPMASHSKAWKKMCDTSSQWYQLPRLISTFPGVFQGGYGAYGGGARAKYLQLWVWTPGGPNIVGKGCHSCRAEYWGPWCLGERPEDTDGDHQEVWWNGGLEIL